MWVARMVLRIAIVHELRSEDKICTRAFSAFQVRAATALESESPRMYQTSDLRFISEAFTV